MANKIRWGILSTADINSIMVPAIHKDERCEIVAIASRDLRKARECSEKLGIHQAYEGYDTLLADREIDAVYISLPNSMHHEWCIKAAKAGKHILCEKPLATSVDESQEMIYEAQKKSVFLQEGFMYRYHPQTLKMKELVQAKTVGKVNYLYGTFSYSYFQAYRENAMTNYRTKPEMGGGCLWDIGSYVINYLRYLAGTEPIEVFGHSEILPGYEVEGIFCGQLRFPDQVLAQFECSYMQAQRCITEVYGNSGSLRIPYSYCLVWDSNEEPIVLMESGKETVVEVENANAYEHEIAHFCDCVLLGRERLIPLTDAVNNIKTLVALRESAKTGKVIKVTQ